MPKIAYDFTREMVFYLIKCNDDSTDECYCGSTFDFLRRKAQHKTVCNNENDSNHNLKIYQKIRENGGWSNFSMTMIDRKIVKDKLEARKHEQTLIDTHKAKLNTNRAFSSEEQTRIQKAEYNDSRKEQQAEYYVSHKEELTKYQADYRASNREAILKQHSEYRASHKEKITNYKTEYRASHKEKINNYASEYRAKNKETLNKKSAEYRAKKKALQAETTQS